MSTICIQVINPNTDPGMRQTIAEAARAAASPGTDIVAVCPPDGVPSIEGHFDEAIAAVGVLEQIKAGRQQGVSGHVIACFGDPGLLAARELAQGPVIGIAEAAMHMATLVATRFSVVTTLPRTLIIARHLLHQYGFHEHCAGLHAIYRCWRWKMAAAWRRKKYAPAVFRRYSRMAAALSCWAAAAWRPWRSN